ncbi:stage II sporulation protein M [archaeon]|nr:stage II sporulation protein M [archaeon]
MGHRRNIREIMVLESLIGVKKAERHPSEMLLFGMLFASVALLVSLVIFKSEASLVLVFLTVLAALPFTHRLLRYEEKKDEKIKGEYKMIKEHSKALKCLIWLFVGFVLAFSIWFVFLPSGTVTEVFSSQLATISAINAQVATGGAVDFGIVSSIIGNNMRVLLFTLIFSLFYGAGAIFILTWNASVIAAAVGTFVRNGISEYASSIGLAKVTAYFGIFSLGLARYMTHGIIEILAYFIAGLAGGLISIALINRHLLDKTFRKILLDACTLMALAIVLVIIGALVEVYITPLLF